MYCKCKTCGGPMAVEYIGSYGEIHAVTQNGTISLVKKIRMYETDGGEPLVYCKSCGASVDWKDFEHAK